MLAHHCEKSLISDIAIGTVKNSDAEKNCTHASLIRSEERKFDNIRFVLEAVNGNNSRRIHNRTNKHKHIRHLHAEAVIYAQQIKSADRHND